MWGNATDTKRVIVDEKSAYITYSLDSALRHVRDRTRTLLIWADALCIDQTNVQERNHQVSIMWRIYSAARSTIIFLGEATATLDRIVLNFLRVTQSPLSGTEPGDECLPTKSMDECLRDVSAHVMTMP